MQSRCYFVTIFASWYNFIFSCSENTRVHKADGKSLANKPICANNQRLKIVRCVCVLCDVLCDLYAGLVDGRPATDVRQSGSDADLLVPGRGSSGHHPASSLHGSRPVPGVSASHETCRKYGRGIHRNATAVGSSGGYISVAPGDGSASTAAGQSSSPARPGSTDFDDVIVGTSGCPWVIEALPGQRVNLTLLDFMQQRRVTTPAAAASADGTSSHRQISQRPGKLNV